MEKYSKLWVSSIWIDVNLSLLILNIFSKYKISFDKVYATGSNKAKVEKILELGITEHYDNNQDVIDQLNGIGKKI